MPLYLKYNRIHEPHRNTRRERREKERRRMNILTSSGQEILVLTNVSEEKDVQVKPVHMSEKQKQTQIFHIHLASFTSAHWIKL